MIPLQLLWSYIRIGMFSFGGGYCMIPLMKAEIVTRHGWLSLSEFIDVIAIAEMTPGPVAVNTATFVGYRVGGVAGALAATFGVVLAPSLIVLTLTTVLWKFRRSTLVQTALAGVRAAVIALILGAAVMVGRESVVDGRSLATAGIVFAGVVGTRIHPVLFLIAAGTLGWVSYG